MKPTGSFFQNIGSAYNKFGQMQSQGYELGPKIELIKKRMEEDRKKREERMKIFNAAVSMFSTGMQNWETQKGIDVGKTLSEGTVPSRSLWDKLGIAFSGPTGDPTGKYGAIGSSAGNLDTLQKLLDIFGRKGTTELAPVPPPPPPSYPEDEEEKSDFRFSIFS